MATSVTSREQDYATARSSVTAVSGQKLVAQEQIVMRDEFQGATLDETARWTKATASGGSVTQATATGCTLDSSTNSAGSASITSQAAIPLLAGSEVALKTTVRFGTDGEANNTRHVALWVDSSNYAEFCLDGTSLVCRVIGNEATYGSDTTINMVQPNDNTFMDLEIRAARAPDRVHFVVNDVQVGSYEQRGSSTKLFQGMIAYAYFKTLNSGATSANTIIVSSVLATRRWNAFPQEVKVKRLAASGLVVRGPCFYVGCTRTGSGSTTAATIYDNTSATGTIVDAWHASNPSYYRPQAPIFCANGIYVSYGSGTDDFQIYYIA